MRLQPLHGNVWAQNILTHIPSDQAVLRSRQVGAVLKALVQDASQLGSYSNSERTRLLEITDLVEIELQSNGETSLTAAIAAVVETQTALAGDTLQLWNRFREEQSLSLQRILSVFGEKNSESLSAMMLNAAALLWKDKRCGTAWTFAKLASEYPKTQERAKEDLDRFEGKRRSLEYSISDLFDHGGFSIVTDLVSLFPAVGLTRKISRIAWLAKQSLWVRTPLTMLAGGAIHWSFTKAVKFATDYTGKILPDSLKEGIGEFASSTAQASLALFLSNRSWMWGRPALVKEAKASAKIAAAAMEKPTLTGGGKLLNGIGEGYRAIGWGTKWVTKNVALKAGGVIGISNLLAQIPMHHLGLKDMTPQGLPSWAWKNTRREVAETYGARRLFRDFQSKMKKGNVKTTPFIDPDELERFLTELDYKIDGAKRGLAKTILEEAAARIAQAAAPEDKDRLSRNILPRILQKKNQRDLLGANQIFEHEDIPLRFEADLSLCITDSEDFPCQNPPKDP